MRSILSSPTSLLNALTTKSCACERRQAVSAGPQSMTAFGFCSTPRAISAIQPVSAPRLAGLRLSRSANSKFVCNGSLGITSLIDRTWNEGSRDWTVTSICSLVRRNIRLAGAPVSSPGKYFRAIASAVSAPLREATVAAADGAWAASFVATPATAASVPSIASAASGGKIRDRCRPFGARMRAVR